MVEGIPDIGKCNGRDSGILSVKPYGNNVRHANISHVWQHLESPLSEADLPRGLEGSGEVRNKLMAEWGENNRGATDGVPTHAA
eukprot:scaffold177241_cov14-Tisochrysis_lutea.AAC.1